MRRRTTRCAASTSTWPTCPISCPTLAVVATFAGTPTRIRGVGFIRGKESDRLGDLARELAQAGARCRSRPTTGCVHPSGAIRCTARTWRPTTTTAWRWRSACSASSSTASRSPIPTSCRRAGPASGTMLDELGTIDIVTTHGRVRLRRHAHRARLRACRSCGTRRRPPIVVRRRCPPRRRSTRRSLARRDRDALKALVIGGVVRSGALGVPVDAIGEQFADEVAADWMRADTVAPAAMAPATGAPDGDRVGVAASRTCEPLATLARRRRRAVGDAARGDGGLRRRATRRRQLPWPRRRSRRLRRLARRTHGGRADGRPVGVRRRAGDASCWRRPHHPVWVQPRTPSSSDTRRESRRDDERPRPREARPQAVAEERARVRRARRGRRARRAATNSVRTSLAFVAFCLAASGTYFWNDILDVEADRLPPDQALPADRLRRDADRAPPASSARRCSSSARAGRRHRALADRGRGRRLRRADADVQRVAEARRRGRPRRRRRRVRAAGDRRRRGRRRADVDVVRAVHHVRLAVHRHRQALRRAARAGRGRRRDAGHARRRTRSATCASCSR